MIIYLFDEFFIEFFKFECEKDYKETNISDDYQEKNKTKLEYYDLGKEDDEMNKETELILMDRIFISEVKSLNLDKKNKNIIHIIIIDNKDKKLKKHESNSYEIVLDFASDNVSKPFAKMFKSMVNDFKEKNK